MGEQLVWDESVDVATTHDLGESGWMALRLFAFYAERADLEMPDNVPPLLELDADWRAASESKFERIKHKSTVTLEPEDTLRFSLAIPGKRREGLLVDLAIGMQPGVIDEDGK